MAIATVAVARPITGRRSVTGHTDSGNPIVTRNDAMADPIIASVMGALPSYLTAVERQLTEVNTALRAPTSSSDAHERADERQEHVLARQRLAPYLSTAKGLGAWFRLTRDSLEPGRVQPGNIIELTKGKKRHLFVVFNRTTAPHLRSVLEHELFTKAVGQEVLTLATDADLCRAIAAACNVAGTVTFDGETGWRVRVH